MIIAILWVVSLDAQEVTVYKHKVYTGFMDETFGKGTILHLTFLEEENPPIHMEDKKDSLEVWFKRKPSVFEIEIQRNDLFSHSDIYKDNDLDSRFESVTLKEGYDLDDILYVAEFQIDYDKKGRITKIYGTSKEDGEDFSDTLSISYFVDKDFLSSVRYVRYKKGDIDTERKVSGSYASGKFTVTMFRDDMDSFTSTMDSERNVCTMSSEKFRSIRWIEKCFYGFDDDDFN